MKKQYKLKKLYPGSPELGYISKPHSEIEANDNHYWMGSWFDPTKFSEFWEEIIDEIPYALSYSGSRIFGVTRLTDNTYFNIGARVKIEGNNSVGFVYGIGLEPGTARLKIDHTFNYLLRERGINQLAGLRLCEYTKEDVLRGII